MKPKRIQRKRTKGWRMPENTVYVGRPTKWGNPFKVGERCLFGFKLDAKEAVAHFRRDAVPALDPGYRDELLGKDLACWCRLDSPCHADVLLEWANEA